MTHAIDLKDVTRVYGSGSTAVRALSEVNLAINKGEWIGLKGRSGSGKTTLINCIGGLDRPTAGRVLVFGEDIHAMSDARLTQWRRGTVGYVFQAFALMPTLSAFENVELPMRIAGAGGGRARKARVEHCLELVGLVKWMDHRPGEMSGGQQQRVALARALANSPKLLLADEPTGELDTQTAREMLAVLRRVAAEEAATIVMTSHDPLALEQADRVIQLVDGRLA